MAGNTTNPYLTKKAQEKRRLSIPVVAVCTIFGLGAASAGIDLFREGKTLSGVMAVLLLAALFTPVVRTFAHYRRSASARRIAGTLLATPEESLTFDQLQTTLSSAKAPQKLRALVSGGYLQNLQINADERTVKLYTPEYEYVQWVCSGCGAKNRERKGGAMRCKYCHNPETWAEGGTEWTVDALFQRVWRYRNYWGKKGGITVSGGEPLRQMEFLTAFFELARSKGVHTALDTAGQPFRPDDAAYLADFDRLMKSTSLVILDLKEIDPEKHRRLTGRDNANILAMARHISDLGVPLWIRHVLVPGLTDDEDGLRKTAEFISSLKTVQRVEVLPYHTLGLFKWQKLGIPYPLPDAVPPTAEQVKRAEELLEVSKYTG